MNAKQIYAMKPTEISNEIDDLFPHMKELAGYDFYLDDNTDPRIEIKRVAYHNEDYERGVWLSTAWFDGVPFMVMQRAGRGGMDHIDEFITNVDVYINVVKFVMDKAIRKSIHHSIIDENEDDCRLTEFYGYELDMSKIDG